MTGFLISSLKKQNNITIIKRNKRKNNEYLLVRGNVMNATFVVALISVLYK